MQAGPIAQLPTTSLAPIVGALDMLARQDLRRRLIAGAAQSAERAKVRVQRRLASRRQPLQAVAVDVARLIEGMAHPISSTSGPQIKVVVEVADSLLHAGPVPASSRWRC